mgnify:CR=1 FL=1
MANHIMPREDINYPIVYANIILMWLLQKKRGNELVINTLYVKIMHLIIFLGGDLSMTLNYHSRLTSQYTSHPHHTCTLKSNTSTTITLNNINLIAHPWVLVLLHFHLFSDGKSRPRYSELCTICIGPIL